MTASQEEISGWNSILFIVASPDYTYYRGVEQITALLKNLSPNILILTEDTPLGHLIADEARKAAFDYLMYPRITWDGWGDLRTKLQRLYHKIQIPSAAIFLSSPADPFSFTGGPNQRVYTVVEQTTPDVMADIGAAISQSIGSYHRGTNNDPQ